MNKNSGARTAGDGDVPVIVNGQHDFCPSGALAVPDGEAVIPVINRLAAQIAHVVLTQDWHPPGHTSLASLQPGKQPFETIDAVYGQQVL
jgi:nicotinamidase/pyrazinamidase